MYVSTYNQSHKCVGKRWVAIDTLRLGTVRRREGRERGREGERGEGWNKRSGGGRKGEEERERKGGGGGGGGGGEGMEEKVENREEISKNITCRLVHKHRGTSNYTS